MDVVVIEFDGQIEDFPVLVQSLDGLIAEGSQRIAIDLHTIPFINSTALGYLVAARSAMEAQGGEIVLVRVQPAILHILEMTSLDLVFPVFPSIEEAVEHLQGEEERAVRRHAWR